MKIPIFNNLYKLYKPKIDQGFMSYVNHGTNNMIKLKFQSI